MDDLWICPECGARFVSRNIWHSCGSFSLEQTFVRSNPKAIELARKYLEMLASLGDVQIIPQKTRLTCVARVRFAGLQPKKDYFVATFALQRRLESGRVSRLDDYGPRWLVHHVPIRAETDLDEELRGWLQESHDIVGMQADLRRRE